MATLSRSTLLNNSGETVVENTITYAGESRSSFLISERNQRQIYRGLRFYNNAKSIGAKTSFLSTISSGTYSLMQGFNDISAFMASDNLIRSIGARFAWSIGGRALGRVQGKVTPTRGGPLGRFMRVQAGKMSRDVLKGAMNFFVKTDFTIHNVKRIQRDVERQMNETRALGPQWEALTVAQAIATAPDVYGTYASKIMRNGKKKVQPADKISRMSTRTDVLRQLTASGLSAHEQAHFLRLVETGADMKDAVQIINSGRYEAQRMLNVIHKIESGKVGYNKRGGLKLDSFDRRDVSMRMGIQAWQRRVNNSTEAILPMPFNNPDENIFEAVIGGEVTAGEMAVMADTFAYMFMGAEDEKAQAEIVESFTNYRMFLNNSMKSLKDWQSGYKGSRSGKPVSPSMHHSQNRDPHYQSRAQRLKIQRDSLRKQGEYNIWNQNGLRNNMIFSGRILEQALRKEDKQFMDGYDFRSMQTDFTGDHALNNNFYNTEYSTNRPSDNNYIASRAQIQKGIRALTPAEKQGLNSGYFLTFGVVFEAAEGLRDIQQIEFGGPATDLTRKLINRTDNFIYPRSLFFHSAAEFAANKLDIDAELAYSQGYRGTMGKAQNRFDKMGRKQTMQQERKFTMIVDRELRDVQSMEYKREMGMQITNSGVRSKPVIMTSMLPISRLRQDSHSSRMSELGGSKIVLEEFNESKGSYDRLIVNLKDMDSTPYLNVIDKMMDDMKRSGALPELAQLQATTRASGRIRRSRGKINPRDRYIDPTTGRQMEFGRNVYGNRRYIAPAALSNAGNAIVDEASYNAAIASIMADELKSMDIQKMGQLEKQKNEMIRVGKKDISNGRRGKGVSKEQAKRELIDEAEEWYEREYEKWIFESRQPGNSLIPKEIEERAQQKIDNLIIKTIIGSGRIPNIEEITDPKLVAYYRGRKTLANQTRDPYFNRPLGPQALLVNEIAVEGELEGLRPRFRGQIADDYFMAVRGRPQSGRSLAPLVGNIGVGGQGDAAVQVIDKLLEDMSIVTRAGVRKGKAPIQSQDLARALDVAPQGTPGRIANAKGSGLLKARRNLLSMRSAILRATDEAGNINLGKITDPKTKRAVTAFLNNPEEYINSMFHDNLINTPGLRDQFLEDVSGVTQFNIQAENPIAVLAAFARAEKLSSTEVSGAATTAGKKSKKFGDPTAEAVLNKGQGAGALSYGALQLVTSGEAGQVYSNYRKVRNVIRNWTVQGKGADIVSYLKGNNNRNKGNNLHKSFEMPLKKLADAATTSKGMEALTIALAIENNPLVYDTIVAILDPNNFLGSRNIGDIVFDEGVSVNTRANGVNMFLNLSSVFRLPSTADINAIEETLSEEDKKALRDNLFG